MATTSERTEVGRRGAPELRGPAAVAAAGVLAVQAAQLLASTIVSFVNSASFATSLVIVASIGEQIAFAGVPFALGVFLTLWLVRPVVARSSVWRVIGGGAIAAVGGGILMFVVQLLLQIVRSPDYNLMGRIPGVSAFYSVGSSLNAIINGMPLVVLAVVLLWLYLRRRANSPAISGTLEEA